MKTSALPAPWAIRLIAALSLILGFSATLLSAAVVPHPLFNDHAVLQQGGPVPVWGTADPGEEVTVEFRGQSVETTTDTSGRWRVELDPGDAGGPFELVIAGSNTIRLRDVLVGEVWVCSGQSNMEWALRVQPNQQRVVNGAAEVAKADYPTIRQFRVPRVTAGDPSDSIEAEWVVCSPETAPDFSAVAFFFARDLSAARGVPIGLINSSWGGTPAQAWTSAETIARFPIFADDVARVRQFAGDPEGAAASYRESLEAWYQQHDPGSEQAWYRPSDDTEGWMSMALPTAWEDAGVPDFDGVAWLKRTFDLPAEWEGYALIFEAGLIDDADTTWINGVEIGATDDWRTARKYSVSPEILQPEGNVIAIRVLDRGGVGGIRDVDSPLRLTRADNREQHLDLKGEWWFKRGVHLSDSGRPPQNLAGSAHAPSVLYNGMIAPLLPYAMRGVIWYQGESNAGNPGLYRELFPAMIADWRNQWGRGDFPFLYVQIAPYQGQPPEIREAQLLSLDRADNTAMVVTIDVGDPDDIHPPNKEPVGERLALAARALAYDEDVVYSGPLFERLEVVEDRAIVHFSHVGPGLVSAIGSLRGFEVAGEDGEIYPAKAVIEGETVVVTSPEVPAPSAVRYGWANVADGNLFNRAGLPASPFRSDAPPIDPDPTLWDRQIAVYHAKDAAEPPPAGAIVAVGSSSVRLWFPRIIDDLSPLTVIPRGFGGSHFSDLNHHFDKLVGRYSPRAILVYEGDNDITSGKSPGRVSKDFETFVAKVEALEPTPRVYVISVKPSVQRAAVWPRMQVLNDRIRELCEASPNLVFIDVASPLLTEDGEMDPQYYVEDGIHLNELGYDRWAQAIREVLVPAEEGFEESELTSIAQ